MSWCELFTGRDQVDLEYNNSDNNTALIAIIIICAILFLVFIGVLVTGIFTLHFTNDNNKWPKVFDVRPHRRRTWTVRLYSPVGVNVYPQIIHASLGPLSSTSQIASRSVQLFLQGWRLWRTDRETDRPHCCVFNNRLHYTGTVMRPNNNKWSKNFDKKPDRRGSLSVKI